MTAQTLRVHNLVNKTLNAYSHGSYALGEWWRCCELLIDRGYSDTESEAILRSKWTRWAGDASSVRTYGNYTAEDLGAFIDDPKNRCSNAAVQELVS